MIVNLSIADVLHVGAAAGLSAIPGYGVTVRVVGSVRWPWIAAPAGSRPRSPGYLLAWHGIERAGGGPALNRRQRFAAVLVGFGGLYRPRRQRDRPLRLPCRGGRRTGSRRARRKRAVAAGAAAPRQAAGRAGRSRSERPRGPDEKLLQACTTAAVAAIADAR
jgi:hypothetical protein